MPKDWHITSNHSLKQAKQQKKTCNQFLHERITLLIKKPQLHHVAGSCTILCYALIHHGAHSLRQKSEKLSRKDDLTCRKLALMYSDPGTIVLSALISGVRTTREKSTVYKHTNQIQLLQHHHWSVAIILRNNWPLLWQVITGLSGDISNSVQPKVLMQAPLSEHSHGKISLYRFFLRLWSRFPSSVG